MLKLAQLPTVELGAVADDSVLMRDCILAGFGRDDTTIGLYADRMARRKLDAQDPPVSPWFTA